MSRQLQPCGTQGAYRRHLRKRPREVPCDPCLAAEAARKARYIRWAARQRELDALGQLIALIAAECDHAGLLPGFTIGKEEPCS